MAQEQLGEKQRLYRSVLEASADCIKIIGCDGRIELMNSPGRRLMDIPESAEIVGEQWSGLWPGDMKDTIGDAVRRAAQGETVRFKGFCPTFAGTPKWWDVAVTPIRAADDEVTRILAISRDCTSERQKSEQLVWASEHDALTALPNRRAFQKRLRAAALRSMRNGRKLGLLLIDLDHFKHVNDTLGHPLGDKLLVEISRRLRQSVRETDFVARVGGDEFAVVVEDLNHAADLLVVGNAVTRMLKAPLRLDGRGISSGASIGGAMFPDDADTANELFKLADTALYDLKTEGRGGTRLFHAYMREEAQRAASQLNLARFAVNEQTVTPVFQPKVHLQTGEIVGFEALLRWRLPSGVLQLPDSIEEAFKEYELASGIAEAMQRRVFDQIGSWITRGVRFGRVSLNAAPAEFLRDDYAERLLERLAAAALPARHIELEVTEHALMERGSKYVERALSKLKAAGVTIALDDFGTGCSSLSHLRDFPVDVVKIDKSFIQKVTDDNEIAAIVSGVVNLTRSLNIESVAEGIETDGQLALVRTMGCMIGQGYALGRPVSGDVIGVAPASRAAA